MRGKTKISDERRPSQWQVMMEKKKMCMLDDTEDTSVMEG